MSDVESFLAGQGPMSRAFYRFVRAIMGVLLVYNRMTMEGREHLPAEGPFVLAPVHRSYIDTPISSRLTTRRLRFMGKDTMWKRGWSAWLLSALGAFPVSRGKADREALGRCVAVLNAGEPLVLFPEGERKSGPVVQPLYDGAVYVALKAGVPIIPVGIGGSEGVMPKGAKLIYPRKVHVIVGEPILPPPSTTKHVPRADVKALSAVLHATLQRLFDEAQAKAGVPNPTPVSAPTPK